MFLVPLLPELGRLILFLPQQVSLTHLQRKKCGLAPFLSYLLDGSWFAAVCSSHWVTLWRIRMKKGGAKQEKQKNTPKNCPIGYARKQLQARFHFKSLLKRHLWTFPTNIWVLSPLSITEMAKARGSVFVTWATRLSHITLYFVIQRPSLFYPMRNSPPSSL